jgi:hypothetical protein
MQPDEELRLRELANELAKDVEEGPEILKRLGFSTAEYEELCGTNMFRAMLDQAFMEWGGVVNTPKRVKLKAAVNIENGLPDMFQAMVNANEPLASRVKVFEVMARIGGLGNPEPMHMDNGQSFNLTIHLDPRASAGAPPIVIESVVARHSQSDLLASVPLEVME